MRAPSLGSTPGDYIELLLIICRDGNAYRLQYSDYRAETKLLLTIDYYV